MTKSEARAIEEMCARALCIINNNVPGTALREQQANYEKLKPAVDEIERVRKMALAEIEVARG